MLEQLYLLWIFFWTACLCAEKCAWRTRPGHGTESRLMLQLALSLLREDQPPPSCLWPTGEAWAVESGISQSRLPISFYYGTDNLKNTTIVVSSAMQITPSEIQPIPPKMKHPGLEWRHIFLRLLYGSTYLVHPIERYKFRRDDVGFIKWWNHLGHQAFVCLSTHTWASHTRSRRGSLSDKWHFWHLQCDTANILWQFWHIDFGRRVPRI